MNVVHVTHEAVEKIGGIGAVIAGLVTADSYQESVGRTILLGPMFRTDKSGHERIGNNGKVIYSTVDDICPPEWAEKFRAIERTYDVGVVYGTREVQEPCGGQAREVEVLLIDVFHANQPRLNLFKAELWKKFSIPSDRFEHIWEYEEYIRLAEPGLDALRAIGCDGDDPVVLLSHEYMGMPTVLKAILDGSRNTRTVFYAHEVASVRGIVEDRPGHDLMFYNVMERAAKDGQCLEDLFPEVLDNFKHPLVKAARYCDHVFAVGDYVQAELLFLDRHFHRIDIDLVYNGIPATKIDLADRQVSRDRMRDYARNLLGFRPTWVFSHVCRPVMSKGLWRNLQCLHEMEPLLDERGESAVFFLLATMAGQRRSQDIRQMERVYGWPVAHENGYPDLCMGEEGLGEMFDGFNRTHQSVRAVFVNQWDWNRHVCGQRMPEDMSFADIRHGTDVEFGLSIYEPFGISQLEPLCFGAICVLSNVCGCAGYARAEADSAIGETIVEADFIAGGSGMSLPNLLAMGPDVRDQIEGKEVRRLAREIFDRLPRTEAVLKRQLQAGYELGAKMGWEHVVSQYFLPSLGRATSRRD